MPAHVLENICHETPKIRSVSEDAELSRKSTIAYEFLIEYNIELAALSIHLLLIFKFLNSCILLNIGPIDTKPEIFPNVIRLFLTVWVSCCLSHNKPTSTQPSLV